MDRDQEDFKAFIKTHYPDSIRREDQEGYLEFNTSIFFESKDRDKKSSVILIAAFNVLYYGADIQFVHFAGKESEFDQKRIEVESNKIRDAGSFYLYSKNGNSLKYFGLYSCQLVETNRTVIEFFEKLNRAVKDEQYKLSRVLVLKRNLTLKDLTGHTHLNTK